MSRVLSMRNSKWDVEYLMTHVNDLDSQLLGRDQQRRNVAADKGEDKLDSVLRTERRETKVGDGQTTKKKSHDILREKHKDSGETLEWRAHDDKVCTTFG